MKLHVPFRRAPKTLLWLPGLVAVMLCMSTLLLGAGKEIVYVSPVPGSHLVSEAATIIIRTEDRLDPSLTINASVVAVTGDVSGPHPGMTKLVEDNRTIIFKPNAPFTPGELVNVSLTSGARTQDGREVEPLHFFFTVTTTTARERALCYQEFRDSTSRLLPSVQRAEGGYLPKSAFGSDSLPSGFPLPNVLKSSDQTCGSIFLATFDWTEVGQAPRPHPEERRFVMILSDSNEPSFYKKVSGMSVDFKLQPNGYLTYFDAAAGEHYELDSTYAVIDSFRCGHGYPTDLHELIVLPDGHAFVFGSDPETVNMSSIVKGGSKGARVLGAVIQELDKNKNVVFEWRSFDHFKITDATHENLTASTIDYVHENALDIDTDGNLLLSSRHMDEITKIDRTTGAILWRLGGKNNQFQFTNDPISFSHQHCIRRTPTGTLLLFDDGNFHTPAYSRAVEYSMDEAMKTVTLVWEFRHVPQVYASAMGSVQRLSNGNTLIGWGTTSNPAVTEVRPDGSIAYELSLPDGVVSYRAFRFPWAPSVIASVPQEGQQAIPADFSLEQNYPNPFNPGTVIPFTVLQGVNVNLTVYDLLGRRVQTLLDANTPVGRYLIHFDATGLASGIYLYRLRAGGEETTRLMNLVR